MARCLVRGTRVALDAVCDTGGHLATKRGRAPYTASSFRATLSCCRGCCSAPTEKETRFARGIFCFLRPWSASVRPLARPRSCFLSLQRPPINLARCKTGAPFATHFSPSVALKRASPCGGGVARPSSAAAAARRRSASCAFLARPVLWQRDRNGESCS